MVPVRIQERAPGVGSWGLSGSLCPKEKFIPGKAANQHGGVKGFQVLITAQQTQKSQPVSHPDIALS